MPDLIQLLFRTEPGQEPQFLSIHCNATGPLREAFVWRTACPGVPTSWRGICTYRHPMKTWATNYPYYGWICVKSGYKSGTGVASGWLFGPGGRPRAKFEGLAVLEATERCRPPVLDRKLRRTGGPLRQPILLAFRLRQLAEDAAVPRVRHQLLRRLPGAPHHRSRGASRKRPSSARGLRLGQGEVDLSKLFLAPKIGLPEPYFNARSPIITAAPPVRVARRQYNASQAWLSEIIFSL
jgi:hypothetical protein